MVADVNLTHLFRINQTPPIFMAPLENIVILKKYIYNEKHEILKARKVYDVEKYSQIKRTVFNHPSSKFSRGKRFHA